MNEALQFGHHPDADQISAFVEHALPPHEQEQMLAHLADCQECRAIVALSLPAVEGPLEVTIASTRRPWWAGWKLALPAAAALAALATFSVTIRHTVVAPGTVAPIQSAGSHPPAPPVASGQSKQTANEPPLRGSEAQSGRGANGTKETKTPALTQVSPEGTIAAKSISELPLNGRNVAALNHLVQPPPAEGSTGQGEKPAAGFIGGTEGGLGTGYGSGMGANPGDAFAARASNVPQGQPAVTAVASAPAPAAAPALARSASETVEVSSAGHGIETASPNMSTMTIAPAQVEAASLKHPLPSRLPVLSMAAQGSRILAIDTRNAVYVSEDNGEHWKAVRVQWQGRAVSAVLVGFPVTNRAVNFQSRAAVVATLGASNAAVAVSGSESASPAPVPAPPAASGSSLSGTVTDPTGAAIPGASVSIRDSLTNTLRTASTDRAGRYLVEGLAPGSYEVGVQAPGFRRLTLTSFAISANGQSVANVSLNIGAATQTVEVTSAAAPIDTISVPMPALSAPSAALFEITTDNGQRWTSADGVKWMHTDQQFQK